MKIAIALLFCFLADGPNGMIRDYPGNPHLIYVPHFLTDSVLNLLEAKGYREWASALREQSNSYKDGDDRLWLRESYRHAAQAADGPHASERRPR